MKSPVKSTYLAAALLCITLFPFSGFAQTTSTIRTIAGKGPGEESGPAATALINEPFGLAVDAAGNVYVADFVVLSESSLTTIRKVSPNGLLSFPLFAFDNTEANVAVDSAGNIYTADSWQNRIIKMTPDGASYSVAGIGKFLGSTGDGGPAGSASFHYPSGVAVDSVGNIYIADLLAHNVRKVTPDGIIVTVAGTGAAGFSGDDGPATFARLNRPHAVAVDTAGNLFIADSVNHSVRKVTPDGVIHTVAGNGTAGFRGDGGPAVFAQLSDPAGIAVDTSGNLFIADANNHRIRQVTPDGIIRTVVGNGTAGFGGDGGPPESAQLAWPRAVAVDAAGSLYIADGRYHLIRKVEAHSLTSASEPAGLERDFSGDGNVDTLWRDLAGTVSMWLLNGYTVTDDPSIASVWNGWAIAGSGDFNGDKRSDALWRDETGNAAIWLMDGSTIKNYGNTESMPKEWFVTGVADFDADGKADILWRDTSGNVLIWLMNGLKIANHGYVATIRSGWDIVGTGDFNGDGKADILWHDKHGNVSTWLMDGFTVSSYSATYTNSSTVAGIADFDGDGRADILWRDASGEVAIWLMNGATVSGYKSMGNVADRRAQ